MKKTHWRDVQKINFDEFKNQHEGYFLNEKEALAKFKELGGKIKQEKKEEKEGE